MAHSAAPILAAVACVSNVELSTRPCESAGSSGEEFVRGVTPWGSLGLLAVGCAFTARGRGTGRGDGGSNTRFPRRDFKTHKNNCGLSRAKIGQSGSDDTVYAT